MRKCEECGKLHDQHSPICMECYVRIYRVHQPIETTSPTCVKDAEGKVVERFLTNAEAWKFVIASGDNTLRLYEGDYELYHQPYMIMETNNG